MHFYSIVPILYLAYAVFDFRWQHIYPLISHTFYPQERHLRCSHWYYTMVPWIRIKVSRPQSDSHQGTCTDVIFRFVGGGNLGIDFTGFTNVWRGWTRNIQNRHHALIKLINPNWCHNISDTIIYQKTSLISTSDKFFLNWNCSSFIWTQSLWIS